MTRPRHRGSFHFGDVQLRVRGPLDLVEKQGRVSTAAPANVYPDLHEIRRYEVTLRRGLAYDPGQRRARVPGAGTIFERLREYTPDDDPRSMSSTLGGLTKLDHAVNTALMLSYVAVAKGDEVGLLGFADAVRAYAPPRRGRRQFLRVTEELRRIEVTTTEPDYRAAFEFLRARSGRRSLVVLFTDLVDEDASRALVAAVNALIIIMLVPLALRGVKYRPLSAGALLRRNMFASILRRRGVHIIDVPAERLTVATIQRYLELKKRLL